jgi:hypothetical protein
MSFLIEIYFLNKIKGKREREREREKKKPRWELSFVGFRLSYRNKIK